MLALVGPFDPPVPVDEVAQAAGILAISVAYLDHDQGAVLMRGHGTLGIILNQNDSPRRRRFSIAHELGHLAIESLTQKVGGDFAPAAQRRHNDTGLERACNYFAGCLLMPRRWVIEHHARQPEPRALASIFDVSAPAMTARLHELRLR